jgi:hypothetical protein
VCVDVDLEMAGQLAPRYRILSLLPSAAAPAVRAAHVAELLDIFGFSQAVLIGGSVAALVAEQRRVAGLVLVGWSGAQPNVTCPVLIVRDAAPSVETLDAFVAECTGCPKSG